MSLLISPLLFLASFGALLVLFASAIAAAIWLIVSFFRAMIGFPRAVRELRMVIRDRGALQADLNRLKRAGV